MMNTTLPVSDFPVSSLLPKKETGVLSFVTKYPNYDGRGIVIAILDSGIDPGAPGLQQTSEGKIKVVERFDCSGCGDINMSVIVKPEDEGFITSLTGKKLKLNPDWNNPEGTYRLGVKNAYDLYPDKLKERMKFEYKKKSWDEGHRKCVAEVTRQLSEFETKHTNLNKLSESEKLEKENFDAKLEILNMCEKKFTDPGTVYDCIMFKDANVWKCCIDTSDNGDLSQCQLIGEYSKTHDFITLTNLDQLNVSMNVHDDGNTLELVGVCSSHGTHVASIAAGYFPEDPEQNGIAPGAQIVSLTIGDGRLGSMETGTALMRAMIKIIDLKKTLNIQVINMSYGEHAHWVDSGRVGDLVNEIVNKYGVIWVSSAGNNGPALGTISTPSDTINEPIISVGAYVSPDMMVAEYAMGQKLPGAPYTWSSRGPTIDGGIGVHICAPGGAITSVPTFTLRYSQLMNGTSMASPHAAGVICVLLSALTQLHIRYSPYSVRRALENTASFISGVEIPAQGAGLIQIEKAFEYLVNFKDEDDRDVRFQIQCGSSCSKGIYLRSKLHNTSHTIKVSVEPHFLDADKVPAETKIYYNQKFVLTCDDSYVSAPTHLDVSNMPRSFTVTIDTSYLPGGVHSTFIKAFDTNRPEKGPVFKIPITVIQPEELHEPKYTVSYSGVSFKPNTIKRYYYVVPKMATWAVLKLGSDEDTGRYVIHIMQVVPRQHCKCLETIKTVAITSKIDTFVPFTVKEDLVLEVVIAKYWANLGEANLDYTISFHGVKPSQPQLTILGANGIHSLEIKSLQCEEVVPSLNFKHSVQILKPSEGKIAPLTARDVIPEHRQIYELVLVYNFNLSKPCEVSPNLALLSDMLYESEYESQFWFLYDSNKQLMGCGDAYPSKYSIKLEKGDYVIRLQVRHDRKDYLEKINDAPLLLHQKLSTAIQMDIYLSYSQALVGGKKAGVTVNTNPSCGIPLYVAPLVAEKFPAKCNNNAHYLTGSITFAKDEYGKKVDTYPVTYILAEGTAKKSAPPNSSEKSKLEECQESVRDLRTQWLSKMDAPNLEKMYETLCNDYPDHYLVHTAYLQVFDPLDKRNIPVPRKQFGIFEDLEKIVNICDQVLSNINEEALLAHIAMKTDLRTDAAKVKVTMDQQKIIYLECLSRKAIALCRLIGHDNNDESKSNKLDKIADLWKRLLKFTDPSDAKVVATPVLFFALWHAFVHNHYGRLAKYMVKLLEDKPNEEYEKRFIKYADLLNWNHVVKHLRRLLPSKYPLGYQPF